MHDDTRELYVLVEEYEKQIVDLATDKALLYTKLAIAVTALKTLETHLFSDKAVISIALNEIKNVK